MGTRADFYIGKGRNAKWVGSVSHDGYKSGVKTVLESDTEESYLKNISELETYIDTSKGWPWPWKTSTFSDYSYYWTDEGIITLGFYHGKKEDPQQYGAGGLHNENNVTNAGFMILGL
jgi:hypothetical protein